MAMSADFFSASASPHSVAMTAGMELPEANALSVIWPVAQPMIRATAIVSPIARPRPSMTAPTRPPLECGMHRAADHLPAGGAERERRLLLACGVVSMTSRASEHDDRRDHDRQDDAGGHERAALRVGAEERAEHREPSNVRGEPAVEARRAAGEHEDAPQAEHDRGHDGEQVDDVDHRLASASAARPG